MDELLNLASHCFSNINFLSFHLNQLGLLLWLSFSLCYKATDNIWRHLEALGDGALFHVVLIVEADDFGSH